MNLHLLQAAEDEHNSVTDLRRAIGSPPATTMRVYLRTLTQVGALERRRQEDFPGTVEYALTRDGRELLAVGEALQRWLQLAPDGPIAIGSTAAKSATKALVDGWSANLVRALAARPLTLTELSRLIPSLSYPALERRLTAMRLAGEIEARRENGRGTPYRVTEWLRVAVAPLAAAMCWERRFRGGEAVPLAKTDVEALFLLAVPLLELPSEASGVCRLTVELGTSSSPDFAGVQLTIENGTLTSCVSRLEGRPDAWVTGTASGWLHWARAEEGGQVEYGGDGSLAEAVAVAVRAVTAPTSSERLYRAI